MIVAADKVGDSFQRVLEAMSIAGMEAERQRVEGSFAEFGGLHGNGTAKPEHSWTP